jgi:toxin ParE1/3/4
MDAYELSQEAEQDLSTIFDYTEKEFGTTQAIDYLLAIEEIFQALIHNPELGRTRNEIRKDLRSITSNSHSIFYRILDKRIRIVRVLHGSRDLDNADV